MRDVVVDGSALTIDEVVAVARGVPLQAVHVLVRSAVPRMDIDREVAAVNDVLPQICQTAAETIPAFQ